MRRTHFLTPDLRTECGATLANLLTRRADLVTCQECRGARNARLLRQWNRANWFRRRFQYRFRWDARDRAHLIPLGQRFPTEPLPGSSGEQKGQKND